MTGKTGLSASKWIWKSLWKMFEGWTCDRKKNSMVLQEEKEIVDVAWLDWLSNEDSVPRDIHQKGRKDTSFGSSALCWSHPPPALLMESELPRTTLSTSLSTACSAVLGAQTWTYTPTSQLKPGGKETDWPLLSCLLLRKCNGAIFCCQPFWVPVLENLSWACSLFCSPSPHP